VASLGTQRLVISAKRAKKIPEIVRRDLGEQRIGLLVTISPTGSPETDGPVDESSKRSDDHLSIRTLRLHEQETQPVTYAALGVSSKKGRVGPALQRCALPSSMQRKKLFLKGSRRCSHGMTYAFTVTRPASQSAGPMQPTRNDIQVRIGSFGSL